MHIEAFSSVGKVVILESKHL